MKNIDFMFEASWEVCNKVGGIHTVIVSKLANLQQQLGHSNLIYIGPDIWKKDTQSPEFEEDRTLFREWREYIYSEKELRVRIGYWNIEGRPKVMLVDFTKLISQKDNILTELWENFSVDSLAGGWNYIESVLLGYAIGKTIESFIEYYNLEQKSVLAHFHEWMTGSGLLYLNNNCPRVSTVFTTHATSLGRSICSNEQQLYSYIESKPQYPDDKARELNIISQHSIEKKSAEFADAFTTVSDLTAIECANLLNKKPDIVVPNGFNPISQEDLNDKRKIGRIKLMEVTKALTGKVEEDTIFIANSGRYEFRNKGIDLLISSLLNLRKKNLSKPIVTFILVPSGHRGVNTELQKKMNGEKIKQTNKILTHYLNYEQNDAILNALSYHQFYNNEDDKVKIIFAPHYLDGTDGIFNLPYYDLLAGFDLSMFPSYYEPWGYTPLESIAYGVPTITTSLAGFGIWADKNTSNELTNGVAIINRNDNNYSESEEEIASIVSKYILLSEEERNNSRDNAKTVAQKAEWRRFFGQYEKAYDLSIEKSLARVAKIKSNKKGKIRKKHRIILKEVAMENNPNWKKLIIQSDLPSNLDRLDELSTNLWWVWHDEAQELFEEISPDTWMKCNKNPVALLRAVDAESLEKIANDKKYLEKLDKVYKEFRSYMDKKPSPTEDHIAYFSMEYGLTNIVKIYSGGLGILAGDYLKAASDTNTPLVAIGFMYRYGYFTQRLSPEGNQLSEYSSQVFSELPAEMLRDENNSPLLMSIDFPGRDVYFRVWRIKVGRVDLYLLDSDTNWNSEEDKQISHKLYGGNWENRIKQELILGFGGVRMLRKLGINTNIYHLNEGHAAFANLERLTYNMENHNLSFEEAMELVRSTSLFTTHTPVPAGHDAFSEDFIRTYLRHIPDKLNISWENFLGLGRFNPNNSWEKFSMSVFAAKTSQEINGVSRLHGDVSKDMFASLWQGYAPNESSIGYVTNGVHYATWTVKEWKDIHASAFGKEYINDVSNKEYWKNIYNVDDKLIWDTRNKLRKRLIDHIKGKVMRNWINRHEDPQTVLDITENLSNKPLTLGFARRFATYKRAHLLFTDKKRLARLLNKPERPVQILFAGKAHPADSAGQDLIKRIVEVSRLPQFVGKILFLENYDMDLAKYLVSGVDVWVNNPTRPLEASGTSGQKAEMNGVLNFSVLDGWWVEGYKEGAGWALPEKRTYNDQNMQDKLDAATIYAKLENEVIPLFYDRDKNNIPVGWIKYIKKSIAEIAPEFTTKRMIDDYINQFYSKLHSRAHAMRANNYRMARELTKWKHKVKDHWNSIEVVSYDFPDTILTPQTTGEKFYGALVLNLKELQDEQIGVEMVFAENKSSSPIHIVDVKELTLEKTEGSLAYYHTEFTLNKPGVYDYGLRIFPKNEQLPHRQDFALLKWL